MVMGNFVLNYMRCMHLRRFEVEVITS